MSPDDAPERVDFSGFAKLASEAAKHAPSEAQVCAAEAAMAHQTREARLEESGIRGALKTDDREAIVFGRKLLDTHALTAVRRWYVGRSQRPGEAQSVHGHRGPRVFAFVGLSGRGKTLAGAWLLAQLGGLYTTAEEMRRACLPGEWKKASWVDRVYRARCVVLDDVGTEEAQGADSSMFELVNQRAGDARAWTLITSNLSEVDFRARYDLRTVRRIEDSGSIVEILGEDLRRKP